MVYTFYSFKGGVGRSMALANVAELLAARGLRVLMIDMDLEAPGLERFFDSPEYLVSPEDIEARRGIIDLLTAYKELRSLPGMGDGPPERRAGEPPSPVEPLRGFVVPLLERGSGSLMLIPAGRRAGGAYADYADQVRGFDWEEFYLRWDGEAFFDWFRQEALSMADVVLVDARTGITELSGVCTFHLADAVVMFVAPNRQNLEGCALMAESLRRPALVKEGRHGRELKILAVPSRIDNSESELLDEFAVDFSARLEPYVTTELRFQNSLFIDLKVPYVPAYAFRESVAVKEPDRAVASEMIAAYERLASTLVELAPAHIARIYRNGPEGRRPDPQGPVEGFVPRLWALEQVAAWIEGSEEPLLLVTGEPGAGKTTFTRWLADAMTASHGPHAGHVPARLVSVHHCRADENVSADARAFVETLVLGLVEAVEGYALRIQHQRNPKIHVEVKRQISATGADIPIVSLIDLGETSPVAAFEELVVRPLQNVLIDEPLLAIVDGVEVGVGLPGQESIVDLLSQVAAGRFASFVRFVVTSRQDPRVLHALRASRFDLLADEPEQGGDLREYVRQRLQSIAAQWPDDQRRRAEDIVCARADGSFLYANLLLGTIAAGDAEADALPTLPDSLSEFYRKELMRLFRADPGAQTIDSKVLGVLAVARGPLSRSQLAGIAGWPVSALDETLVRWSQFLEVEADGSVRLFHSSFRDFLLADDTPTFGIYADEANEAIVSFLLTEAERGWSSVLSEYGPRHVLGHLFAAVAAARDRGVRQARAITLAELLRDPEFLLAKVSRGGADSLIDDLVTGGRALAPLSRTPGVEDRLVTALEALVADLRVRLPKVDPAQSIRDLLTAVSALVADVYAEAYMELRSTQPPSGGRTSQMNVLVGEVRQLAERGLIQGVDLGRMLEGHDGERLVALVILKARPDPVHFDAICDAIAQSRSAFEQYHALDIAARILPLLKAQDRRRLLGVLDTERRNVRGLDAMSDPTRGARILELISKLLEDESAPA